MVETSASNLSNRRKDILDSQQGNAMLVVMMIFLIVSILSAGLLGIARVESTLAMNDVRAEMARQAADAGVSIARDVLIYHLLLGDNLPALEPVLLDNGTAILIKITGDKNQDGKQDGDNLFLIRSEGQVHSSNGILLARKKVEAGVFVDPILLKNATEAGSLKSVGRIVTYKYVY